jgi:hypothetical protein
MWLSRGAMTGTCKMRPYRCPLCWQRYRFFGASSLRNWSLSRGARKLDTDRPERRPSFATSIPKSVRRSAGADNSKSRCSPPPCSPSWCLPPLCPPSLYLIMSCGGCRHRRARRRWHCRRSRPGRDGILSPLSCSCTQGTSVIARRS